MKGNLRSPQALMLASGAGRAEAVRRLLAAKCDKNASAPGLGFRILGVIVGNPMENETGNEN